MLSFTPITKYKHGQLTSLLHQSYSSLIEQYPECWEQERLKWDQFDKDAFENPNIGKCLFVTCLKGKPIGLASWDPRGWPDNGVIGQNCIIPDFQGQGFGIKQIEQVLKIFKQHKVKKATVTTSEHPFFIPAQKMYQRLGFQEVKRRTAGPDPKYKVIDFELVLDEY